VIIHVIAEHATITGGGQAPGSMIGADGLIPAELVAELATSAKLVPLVHPGDAAPEPGYVPSKALADFVRCRDLTCRWPGCDRPAVDCDLDHTIPYAHGRAHPRVESQMLLPHPSFGENVLGLARSAIARRHTDPHLTRRAHPCHHTG
jgi:hypothetical protein